MAKKRIRVTAKTSDFAFITDVRLRGDVEDALYFTAYLIDAGDKTRLNRYKEEFYRATVLYIASVIEALCLFFIDNKKLVGTKHEYKYERPLNFPPISLTEGELICAIKVKRNLALKDIPFFEAIKILEQNNLFPKQLAKKINEVRLARNTQHLYSRSSGRMSDKEVKNAFDTLNRLFAQIRKNV